MSAYITLLMSMSLITGTIITASANHWLIAWMGLELNTLAIIPLMAKTSTPRTIEATAKYFLIQATASGVLLFSSTMNAYMTGQWDIMHMTTQPPLTMLTLALAMKLGLAPLHAWLPEVMQGTTTHLAFILATWQKLAPFALLYTLAPMLHMPTLMMLALLSTLLGGWGGLNQTQLRKLMAFSSIAHLGWISAMLPINQPLALITLMLYISMTTTMFSTMLATNMKTLKDMTPLWAALPTTILMLLLTLISLGGLPPTSGFIPKWFILKELILTDLPMIATLMAFASLLSLLFYIRMMYLMSLTISPNVNTMKMKWRLSPPTNMLMTLTLPMTVMILPLTSVLITT